MLKVNNLKVHNCTTTSTIILQRGRNAHQRAQGVELQGAVWYSRWYNGHYMNTLPRTNWQEIQSEVSNEGTSRRLVLGRIYKQSNPAWKIQGDLVCMTFRCDTVVSDPSNTHRLSFISCPRFCAPLSAQETMNMHVHPEVEIGFTITAQAVEAATFSRYPRI